MPERPRHHTAPGAGPARVFVDSGAWIALFSARDQHHGEAEELFGEAVSRRSRLLTTSLVLAEVHRLLLFRAGIQPARRALDRIEASPLTAIVFPDADNHRAALGWLERFADQTITYTDAVSFAVMDGTRCRIALSFDRDFELAGFSLWRRR